MSLTELVQKYSTKLDVAATGQTEDYSELPESVRDWPDRWVETYRQNINTLMVAFDMDEDGARCASEAGTRPEYILQREMTNESNDFDHGGG